jgi:Tfp pilus assembly protein PilN
MIEINLLPGAGKKSRGAGGGSTVGASLATAATKVKDPFMIMAVVSLVGAGAVIAMLTMRQQGEAQDLAAREQKQVQDSTRYAAVLREKKKAETQRDSVMRQLNIIKTIDNDRFVWPHVMDEISRALPQYTWLVSVKQTSAPTNAGGEEPSKDSKDAKDKTKKKSADPEDVPQPMKFSIVGNTVDIQALTRFMKLLQASPFIQNVQLMNSSLVQADGKEVTEFTLEAQYQQPDSSAIRTVPLTLSVR